jgi:citrate synthase
MSEATLKQLANEIISNNTISPDYYQEYDVKRGLRNLDGSGVLAGLTHISSVVGSKKSSHEMVAVDGILTYRNISLLDIAKSCTEASTNNFEKTCFLLLVGRYPSESELSALISYMADHRELPKEVIQGIIDTIPSKDIMNKLQTCISALYAFDTDPDSLDPVENFLKSLRIIAKIPMIVAYSYLKAYKPNAKRVLPTKDMSHAKAFLHMLYEGSSVSSFVEHIIDLSLVLHAEHGGGNNSTFTTYVVSSSGSDIFSSLAAAIASLKGPLHGAANRKVMEMMADIKSNVTDWNNVSEVKAYLAKLIRQEAGDRSGKIYGLGHAVYTKSDPRAIAIKGVAQQIAKQSNRVDEYNLYNLIADETPTVFQEVKQSNKVISPNVDFYSGFVYDCIDIPTEIYTPIFAMARISGWCAHRIEDMLSGKRIIRPGYKFVVPK